MKEENVGGDIIANYVVLTLDHIEKMQLAGINWVEAATPIGIRETDVIALKFLWYILERNEYSLIQVISNLDDIIIWSQFLAVSNEFVYTPINSMNTGTDGHVTPDMVRKWAKMEHKLEMDIAAVHFFCLDVMWWALFFGRGVDGSVEKGEYLMEVAGEEEE